MNDLLDKLRAGPWLVLALIATVLVAILHPHQIGVLIWSLCKLSLGAYLGYWIDRTIFPYARPHTFVDERSPESHATARSCMIRRAIIIAAAIIGLAVGV